MYAIRSYYALRAAPERRLRLLTAPLVADGSLRGYGPRRGAHQRGGQAARLDGSLPEEELGRCRITSYNVCYTKLLRPARAARILKAFGSLEAVAEADPGYIAEKSYNFV